MKLSTQILLSLKDWTFVRFKLLGIREMGVDILCTGKVNFKTGSIQEKLIPITY